MLFRPLLTLTRADTEACCSALALQPRQDVTNADVAYTRNFVRHRIMPVLGEVNPAVQDALLRLSRSATLEEDYLERQAEAAWPGLARVAASSVTFSRQRLAAEHPALRRVLLRRAHVALQGDAIDLEEAHLAAMDGLLEGPAGRSVALPNGLTWSVSYRTAMLAKSTARQASPLPPLSGAHLLACPGVTRIGGWRVRVEYVPPAPSTEGPYTAVLDAEAIGDQPVVRTRKEGDRFWPLGLPQAEGKRLKEFLSDAQVPRAWRDRVPLVEAPRGVAWVVGWQIAHWARITPASTRGLRITFQRAGATETDDGASKE
jgi:tRNA(Ile)-lysidine synthase